MTKKEAVEWMREAIDNELIFGLRSDDYIPSANFQNSTIWVDGEKTDEELNGLCAIEITDPDNIEWAFNEAKNYGTNCYLIVGNSKEYGWDEWADEIIIKNHSIYARVIL